MGSSGGVFIPQASKTFKRKVELFLLFKSLRKTKVFPVKTLKPMVFGSLGYSLLDDPRPKGCFLRVF